MNTFELIAPCHFGLESVLKREIESLGYPIVETDNGKVTFRGDGAAIARANIFLRTAERVMVKVGDFEARTFDQLFEETKAIPWEEYLPADARCWVKKASSINSRLFSASDIQRIMKKALADRMCGRLKLERMPETGKDYPLRVFLYKDRVTVALDTSGESLHKRGYRLMQGEAPITETLAAALIMITPWHPDRILVDPFCGSGTFPIEAAMIAAGIAPGMNRSFTAEDWDGIVPKKAWYEAADEAESLVRADADCDIQGYDIDPDMIRVARENAVRAGVDHLIHFQQRPVDRLSHPKKYGFIITNPPYGERLEEKSALPAIYGALGQRFAALDDWSMFVITAWTDAEKAIGRRADKNRKIYNGMMRTYFYQFMGPKPPRRPRTEQQKKES